MSIPAIETILRSAKDALHQADTVKKLEDVRIQFLGRKSALTALLRSLKDYPAKEQKKIGQRANEVKNAIKELIALKVKELAVIAPLTPHIDLTIPAKKLSVGHLHPLTLVAESVERIFQSMNFSVVGGDEIETEYYNFDALNIPAHHPAREMWDTFWIKQSKSENSKNRLLLRTHTSPVQVRYMELHQPPFQIIVPGRAFRYEATDASHEINFYQVEGLMVGRDVSLANLKYIIREFLKKLVGRDIAIRFRPSYFPFTEPSIEVDIKMGNQWLEIMGAGMLHPNVFSYAHYPPNEWQGFAFGLGLDRVAMIKYGIPDIRLFYSGDTRFTRQFR